MRRTSHLRQAARTRGGPAARGRASQPSIPACAVSPRPRPGLAWTAPPCPRIGRRANGWRSRGPHLAVRVNYAVADDLFLSLGEGTVGYSGHAVANPIRRGSSGSASPSPPAHSPDATSSSRRPRPRSSAPDVLAPASPAT